MRILDRYIVREVVRHALLGLLIFTFVLFVPKLVHLMELIVRHSGSSAQIVQLFLCLIPSLLVFTLPMAVLVGVLLGLGRMSMDSEIIAITALGISRKRILFPVGVLAVVGATLTLVMTLWLAPLSLRTFRDIEGGLIKSQVSFFVQPRVFDERFPRMILYLNDVSASGTHWNGVFLAEAGAQSGDQITLAESAIVIAEPRQGKLELHLNGGATHEFSRGDPDHYSVTAFGRSDWPIEVNGLEQTKEREISIPERSLSQLWHERGKNWRDARVELHQRFAFPVACVVFSLIAVPLGTQPRRGGRAAGTLLAILVIGAYYSLFIMGAGLARQGAVPPSVGMWIAERGSGTVRIQLAATDGNVSWRIGSAVVFRAHRRFLATAAAAGDCSAGESDGDAEGIVRFRRSNGGESSTKRASPPGSRCGNIFKFSDDCRSVSAAAFFLLFRGDHGRVYPAVRNVHFF